jgi:hypothetical protein
VDLPATPTLPPGDLRRRCASPSSEGIRYLTLCCLLVKPSIEGADPRSYSASGFIGHNPPVQRPPSHEGDFRCLLLHIPPLPPLLILLVKWGSLQVHPLGGSRDASSCTRPAPTGCGPFAWSPIPNDRDRRSPPPSGDRFATEKNSLEHRPLAMSSGQESTPARQHRIHAGPRPLPPPPPAPPSPAL